MAYVTALFRLAHHSNVLASVECAVSVLLLAFTPILSRSRSADDDYGSYNARNDDDDHMCSKERRRSRGEIACAECRRLKARCDKQVPCSTCVRRGCSMLCPNGTMPPGEGSRFVDIAEDFLRRKLARTEERMHALEDALAIAQANISGESHPLLVNTSPLDDNETDTAEESESMNEYNRYGLIDALGALSLDKEDSHNGDNSSYGRPSSPESLLTRAKEVVTETPDPIGPDKINADNFPEPINLFYKSFPLPPAGIPTGPVQALIESYLPPIDRAKSLCEIFTEHLAWMFYIVSRRHAITELIPAIYRRFENSSEPPVYGPHDLALLFVVLALGALVDLTLPPYNNEAHMYYKLAQTALNLQSVLNKRSVVTIKVLHLMSIFQGMSGMDSALESSYALLNLACQVAHEIGFHKDPSIWGFTGREAYDRRVYFWNLQCGAVWQSLVTGRPPSIISSYIDCQVPSESEEETFQQGEVPIGFGTWSFRYTMECLSPVAEATLSVKAPSYAATLELDRKIRSYRLPPSRTADTTDRISREMQTYVRSHYRELTLLFLHRGFFAQAMTDFPSDPLKSPYGHSFLTAYQSACVVLAETRRKFNQQPLLCARVWRLWSFAFSAALIVGTVAIPRFAFTLEPPPLEQLELCCDLFGGAARTSTRAKKALPILLGLRDKAIQSSHSPRLRYMGIDIDIHAPGELTLNLAPPVNEDEHAHKDLDEHDCRDCGDDFYTKPMRTGARATGYSPDYRLGPDGSPIIPVRHSSPSTYGRADDVSVPVKHESVQEPLYFLGGSSEMTGHPHAVPRTQAQAQSHPQSHLYSQARSHPHFHLPPHAQHHTLPYSHLQSHPHAHVEGLRGTTIPSPVEDLSRTWESLYRELPGPPHNLETTAVYGTPEGQDSGRGTHQDSQGTMLDDRWASFMHDCTVPTARQDHHYMYSL